MLQQIGNKMIIINGEDISWEIQIVVIVYLEDEILVIYNFFFGEGRDLVWGSFLYVLLFVFIGVSLVFLFVFVDRGLFVFYLREVNLVLLI